MEYYLFNTFEAVPLVDAFDHSDYILDSCLGCYDGNVYDKMYNWARSAPTNQKKVAWTLMCHGTPTYI